MINGAIFDLDGTLLDSMGVWEVYGTGYLESLGVAAKPGLNETIIRMSLAQGCEYLRREYNLPLTVKQIAEGINDMVYDEYAFRVQPKPGAVKFVRKLFDRGIKMAVATATDEPLVSAALKRIGILDCFGKIFTCTKVGHGKDEPIIYNEALSFLGTDKSDTVVFEDALHCAFTAKNAGFRVIGIQDDFEKKSDEMRELCDGFYMSFEEFDLKELI